MFREIVEDRLRSIAHRFTGTEGGERFDAVVAAARRLDSHVMNQRPSERLRVAMALMAANLGNPYNLRRFADAIADEDVNLGWLVMAMNERIMEYQAYLLSL